MSTWYQKLPKAELHLHLEGAIPRATLWELVKKYGGDPETTSLDKLDERFRYRDFPHFIDTWNWMVGYIRADPAIFPVTALKQFFPESAPLHSNDNLPPSNIGVRL